MGTQPVVAVVDDDIGVRKAVGRLLRSAGFDAVTFASAQEFLGDRRQKDVACVILDLKMPDMDGLALQARLAALDPLVPTVFITAHADSASEAQALAAGAQAFLRKPFEDTALLDAVGRALGTLGT
jgi:two-component system response regulator FixJ